MGSQAMFITVAVLVFVALDVLIVHTVLSLSLRPLRRVATQFPAREPAPGAVRRNFQSLSIGLCNFGNCFHIAVDEHHLHLMPTMLLRWLKMRAMSVPWSHVRTVRERRLPFGGVFRVARIGGAGGAGGAGGVEITGPVWCLPPPGATPLAIQTPAGAQQTPDAGDK